MSRLLEEYKSNICSALMSKLNLKNKYEVPKISKIVLNMGIGDGKDDSKLIDKAQEELTLITGQKAIKTKSKKAISGFKIRALKSLQYKIDQNQILDLKKSGLSYVFRVQF